MELYDLATPGGIAAITIALLEVLKKLTITYEIKNKPWYAASVNLSCVIISMGIAFISMSYLSIDWVMALGNGIVGALLAIGGYEPLVNIIRGFLPKKK